MMVRSLVGARRFATAAFAVVSSLAATAALERAAYAEPPECLSADPSEWPSPSKPYFMLIVDTSGSMDDPVATANSCGFPTNNRISHARCAVKNAVSAYAGQVNFGLATYPRRQNCTDGTCGTNDCYSGCSPQNPP